MNRKIVAGFIAVVLVALAQVVNAQQAAKMVRVGFLGGMSAGAFGERLEVVRQNSASLVIPRGKSCL